MEQHDKAALQAQCRIVNGTCAATNLRRASRTVGQLYATILAPSGLEPTQFTLLAGCAIAGTVPMTLLAEALALDRTTLARNLKLLEKQGLVQVAPGEDRRVRVVTLSEQGRRRLVRALPLWEQAQQQVESTFGEGRLRQVLSELAALETSAHNV